MNEYLPRALLVGVSYSDFWGLTPRKLEAFYKSFQERQKAEADRDNQKAWLNGVYVFKAIVAALSSKQSNRYPTSPIHDETDEERFNRIRQKMEAMVTKTKKQEVKAPGAG